MADVDIFLSRLRGAHPDMAEIFTHGSCFELWEIMRVVWPAARPWYSMVAGHVYVEVDGRFYDIGGRQRSIPEDTRCMITRDAWPTDAPHRWSRRTHLRIKEHGELLDTNPRT